MSRIEEHIDPAECSQRQRSHETWLKHQQVANLHQARSDLVAKYRKNPAAWPDGIHGKSDPWYRADEWNSKGEWIAPYQPPWMPQAEPTEAASKSEPHTPSPVNNPVNIAPPVNTSVNSPVNTEPAKNRRQYTREYMRKYRAEKATLTTPSSTVA
jgi:hypothetical protein